MIARIVCLFFGHDLVERVRLSREREALVCGRCDRYLIRYARVIDREARERWLYHRERLLDDDPWHIPEARRLEPLTDADVAALRSVTMPYAREWVREDDMWPGNPPPNTPPPIRRVPPR